MKTSSILHGSLLLAMAVLPAHSQTTAEPPHLGVSLFAPGGAVYAYGSTFPVLVQATLYRPDTEVYGFQFDLRFDPTKLQVVEIKEGPHFKMTGKSDFTPGAIDNAAGVIHTTFGTQQGPSALPKGMTPIWVAEIVFRVVQPRAGSNLGLGLQYPVMVNGTGSRIPMLVLPPPQIFIL